MTAAAYAMPRPTPAEVEAYAASIGFKVDGGYFVDYWEQRGWFVKPGIPMRSWQATIRNWQRMEKAKSGGSAALQPVRTEAEIRRAEADKRQAAVIEEAAQRCVAMRSWIRSGKSCPWSKDPQAEVDAEKHKIFDHYGQKGADALRDAVRRLEEKKP
jgi:hypothetical protein